MGVRFTLLAPKIQKEEKMIRFDPFRLDLPDEKFSIMEALWLNLMEVGIVVGFIVLFVFIFIRN